ncbi:MAG: E3 ubiquitin-protein ligase MARCH [Candidatus Pacebacteria bacterium]|nr:E3 ubiquitin-protein ligase MARCH [Candidatus Paceibacterota bacterium]
MPSDLQSVASSSLASSSKLEINPCRICLGDDLRDLSNPVISPCKCSGSMGNVHLNCLRRWIKQKTTITSSTFVTSVTWKSLACELCKTPYPYAVYFDGNVYELIAIPHIKPPYIVFESVNRSATVDPDSSSIHIVSLMSKPKLKLVPCSLYRIGKEPRCRLADQ